MYEGTRGTSPRRRKIDAQRSQGFTSAEVEPEDAGDLGTAALVYFFVATPLPPLPHPNPPPPSTSHLHP